MRRGRRRGETGGGRPDREQLRDIAFWQISVVIFQLVSIYKLGRAPQLFAWLYLLGAFVPCISLIVLLVINGKATGALQKAGIRVGLLGARLADV